MCNSDILPIPQLPPLPTKEVIPSQANDKDNLATISFKDLYMQEFQRPAPLKERVSSTRVLKLCRLLYPDYEFVKLGGYKSYRRYPFYVEYQIIDKCTDKIVVPRATANTLLELVRDEYYDYDNF